MMLWDEYQNTGEEEIGYVFSLLLISSRRDYEIVVNSLHEAYLE
jgi:hypothetical protein